MYCTSSVTIFERCARLNLGSATHSTAALASVGVFVTSCSGCEKSGVLGVRGERMEEPDEVQERLDSVEVRVPLDLFLRGEVDPKMALFAILAKMSLSSESLS